jgi:hypothetical protein
VVEAVRRRGETAIGFRLAAHADDPERGFGVRVNPPSPSASRSTKATASSSSPTTERWEPMGRIPDLWAGDRPIDGGFA